MTGIVHRVCANAMPDFMFTPFVTYTFIMGFAGKQSNNSFINLHLPYCSPSGHHGALLHFPGPPRSRQIPQENQQW